MTDKEVKRTDIADYPPMLSFKHLTQILGVSKPTLYLLIGRGQLTPRRLGPRRVGFSKKEVQAQFGL